MEPISKISGKPCSEAHFLVELVLARKAAKQKKVLQPKFWNTLEWKQDYKTQIIAANSLLKLFPLDIIVKALNSKECSWMYSLHTKQIPIICQQELNKLETEQKIAKMNRPIEYDSDNVSQVPTVRPKSNVASKLRKLDG